MLAMDKGAAGIIFVSGDEAGDSLHKVMLKQAEVSIPCFQVLRHAADSILKFCEQTVEGTIDTILQSGMPFSFATSVLIEGQSDIERLEGITGNRFAILEGSDVMLRDEYVVIGAHYDHIGLGGKGSASRYQDTIAVHNGADDNASGVSVLLELASRLKSRKDEIRRSLIFVVFGGEELGLLGSKYFTQHSPISLKQITGMINLDMVGRLDTTRGLQVGGAGTSVQADSIIQLANKGNLKLRVTLDGSGPSDHSSFYSRNIPVFFLTTGAHTDYHTPYDDIERINFGGLKVISDFSEQLVLLVANNNEPLTFREAGPRESENPARKFKVTLGFMPDFSATDIDGVRVDIVTKGKAAERAGILNGDIIVTINGTKVHNIYDYMYRLSHLKKNQIISVEVIRNGVSEVMIVQL
jgi:acetylornithine deacetylase/succinyl-diaminopimelate desuccinylase-like protein